MQAMDWAEDASEDDLCSGYDYTVVSGRILLGQSQALAAKQSKDFGSLPSLDQEI